MRDGKSTVEVRASTHRERLEEISAGRQFATQPNHDAFGKKLTECPFWKCRANDVANADTKSQYAHADTERRSPHARQISRCSMTGRYLKYLQMAASR